LLLRNDGEEPLMLLVLTLAPAGEGPGTPGAGVAAP
jgi:hypothetical protein